MITLFAMEKQTPHYRLIDIFALVADAQSVPFTRAALRGGLELGLSQNAMRAVVLRLTRKCFYKSMTTYLNHRVWQDVYVGETGDGTPVYIKVTGYQDGSPPIIQFKKK
jgi:motility quorum-sensing regulator / GCU-specific mRNA interferase toxin